MNLNGLIESICLDLDEDKTDSVLVAKLTNFINRGYKELAKKDLLETSVDVTSASGLIEKPADFYRVANIIYNDEPIEYSEQGAYILVKVDGDMKLYYYKVPADLSGSAEPETHPSNDGVIIEYAKYRYWQSEDQYNKAEAHKRDFEEQLNRIRPVSRKINWSTER